MAAICPNKNLPEWKTLKRVIGEKEAMRVFMAYGDDVPAVFSEKLEDRTVELISKDITRKITTTEKGELSALLKVEATKTSKKEKNYTQANQLNQQLLNGFVKDFNITTEEYDSLQEVFGVDASAMADFVTKFIAMEPGEDITPEIAYVAYKFLGKSNNKLKSTLNYHLQNWDGYQSSWDKHSKVLSAERGWVGNKVVWKSLMRERVAVDFLTETLVRYYNNPQEYKKEADRKWTQEHFTWLQQFKRWIERLISQMDGMKEKGFTFQIGDKTILKVKSKEEAIETINNIGRQIADEIINQEYDLFHYELSEGQMQKFYDETIGTDEQAHTIVKNAWGLGLQLTGSLALRREGTVFRTKKENLHDLDFVVPFNLSEDDAESLFAMKAAAQISAGDPWVKGGVRFLMEEALNTQPWYNKFVKMHPSFQLLTSFVGKENWVSQDSITVTGVIDGQFYALPGFHMERNSRGKLEKKYHRRGDYIRGTGYVIDFFVRLNSVKEENTPKFKDWKEIFVAKLDFSRDKDLKDHKYFIPFKKPSAKDRFMYKDFIHKSKNTYNPGPALQRYLDSTMSPGERETRRVFEKKKSILQKVLNVKIEEDPYLKTAGKVLPYKPGETPTIVINPNYHTGDTLIHEFGHVLIDFMGGMSDPLIRQGRKYLEGSNIEAEVLAKYPDAENQEKLDKEVLATAIGREGEALYNLQTGNAIDRFKGWLQIFMNRLRKAFGLDYNVAFELARQLVNNDVSSLDIDNTGSEYTQEQRLPAAMEPDQQAVNDRITRYEGMFGLTADNKFYQNKADPDVLYQRQSDRTDEVFPKDKMAEKDKVKFEHNRQWGNKIDDIFTGVIEHQSLDQIKEIMASKELSDPAYKTATLSPDAIETIFKTATQFVNKEIEQGNIVRTQSIVYSKDTAVAGTTDILSITPDGHLRIVDIKSSWWPTSRPFKPRRAPKEYTYDDRGQHTSTREKHTRQQSAYQKMYEDLGFVVESISIFPIHLADISSKTHVQNVTAEPIIALQYNKATAHKIIDNKKKRKKEQLTMDPTTKAKLESLAAEVRERVNIVITEYRRTKNEKYAQDLEVLAMQMTEGEDLINIIAFLEEADTRSDSILRRLENIRQGKEEMDGPTLKNIKTFAGTFNLVEDVEKLLAVEKTRLDKIREADKTPQEKLLYRFLFTGKNSKENYLKPIQSKIHRIDVELEAMMKDNAANILAPLSTKTREMYKKRFRKEYQEAHPFTERAGTRKEYWAEVEEYVNEKTAAASAQIEVESKKYVSDLFDLAPKDLSGTITWLSDPKNINDGIIQLSLKMLERADFNVRKKFIDEIATMEDLITSLRKDQGITGATSNTDQLDIYDGILELALDEKGNPIKGKPTGFLVGKYHSSMKPDTAAWFAENNPTRAERRTYFEEAKRKYLNPQWKVLNEMSKDDPTFVMYRYLVNQAKQRDTLVPNGSQLGVAFSDYFDPQTREHSWVYTYRIPTVEQTTMERMKREGLVGTVKEGLGDLVVRDVEDLQYGTPAEEDDPESHASTQAVINPRLKHVLKDEQGKERKFLPIFYRGKHRDQETIFQPSKLQSYDLASIYMMDFHSILNYSEKKDIAADLELILELVGARKVVKTLGTTAVWNKMTGGTALKIEGKESNSYKALQSIVDHRLYGISSVHSGSISFRGKDYSWDKLVNASMAWTGHTMLMVNDLSALTNTMQGKIMNWIEGIADNQVSLKSVRAGEKAYFADLKGIVDDAMGRTVHHSKTNLLADLFDAMSEHTGLKSRFSDNTRAKQLGRAGTLHFMQNSSEHWVQLTLMYAVLKETKVANNKGESISLDEAYEVVENRLVVKEEWKEFVTADLEFETTMRVKELSKMSHGNYDSKNLALAQRYWYGRMGYMLRKWLVPGFQKRFRGMANITPKYLREVFGEDEKFYSEMLGEEVEGTYTTALRFVIDSRAELANMLIKLNRKGAEEQWNKLTQQEKANIKRTTSEVVMMYLVYLATTLMAGLASGTDDDDKKKRLYYMALLLRRLNLELTFYINPFEGYKMLKSPAATISMFQRVGELIEQLILKDLLPSEKTGWFDAEEYVRGDLKGEYKFKKKIRKILPVLSQQDRDAQKIYEWLD